MLPIWIAPQQQWLVSGRLRLSACPVAIGRNTTPRDLPWRMLGLGAVGYEDYKVLLIDE